MAKRRAASKRGMQESEILATLSREWESALGEGDDLETDRWRALDYIHGDPHRGALKKDLPPLKDLSEATSSDVSDAIETVLPDLIEIFTGGEDVVTFDPQSDEDEKAAEQETDYINHVFYSKNDGWMILYTAFKDALSSKTGVLKWWWEVDEEDEERTDEVPLGEEDVLTVLRERQGWERVQVDGEDESSDEDEEVDNAADAPGGAFTAERPEPETTTLRFHKTVKRGRARIATIPPEDFRLDPAVASLADATWAAHKSRARVYELIAQGIDRKQALALPAWVDSAENTDEQARDFLDDGISLGSRQSYSDPLMKVVEIREYHAWMDTDGDGEVECWRFITGADNSELLKQESIEGLQFEAICPYPLTHQFYGRSLADLTTEIQKIKTALMRLMLNHAYFSVNPRPEIAMNSAAEFTLSDLARNRPGAPVRSEDGKAVRWLAPPQLGFDIFSALEYVSTVEEKRTGVVRNAQGLNPDTLHDTAKGAMELMDMAQRRVRMIARIFAETGLKRFFIGLHDLIVRHADRSDYVRLRNGFTQVDPSKWGRRSDLTIDVGLGTNTKSYELNFWQLILDLQSQAQQAGIDMQPQHFWNSAKRLLKAGNVRNPDLFFPNPAAAEAKDGQGERQPPADPETIKAQGEIKLKQQQQQAKQKLDQAEAAAKFQLEQSKQRFEVQLALYKAQNEAGLAERAAATEAQLQKMIAERKLDIEEFKSASKAQTDTMKAAIDAKSKSETADNRIRNVRLGGEIG